VLGIGVVAAGAIAAWGISRRIGWSAAGPLALIASAPLVPHVSLVLSLSADDLLPLLGLGVLIWRQPAPRPTTDRLLRWILIAVGIATVARIATALVNGDGAQGTLNMLAQATARPLVLVAVVSYVAIAVHHRTGQRYLATAVAAVGTFEAAFGLLAFLVRLPSAAGLEPSRPLTSLYGVCPGRITGTLGLSANHLGAIFVLSVPITIGLAASARSWQRWAWAAAASLQCAALVLTFTRSSILLALGLSIAYLIYQRRFALLGGAAVLTAGLLFVAFTVSCSGAPLGQRLEDGNDRLALWYAAGLLTIDHPVFGVGLDHMNDAVNANPDRYRDTPFGPATSSAHNTILLAAAETGVIGGLAALLINVGLAVVAAGSAWHARRPEQALLLASSLALAAYLVQGMVNNLFSVPATSVVLALVIGGLIGSRLNGDGSIGDLGPARATDNWPVYSPASEAAGPDGDH
jgi:O-antigen ligase